MTKKGLRTFDCRAAVVSMTVRAARARAPGSTSSCATAYPASDPTTSCTGMAAVGGLTPGEGVLLTRVAQGRLEDDGTVGDPLA